MPSRQYRLTLEGELSDRAAIAFDGLTLTRERGTTVLRGTVRDQAELQGLLQRIMDLGLTLVSATSVRDATDDRADRDRPVVRVHMGETGRSPRSTAHRRVDGREPA